MDFAVVRLEGEERQQPAPPRRPFGIGWIGTGDPPLNDTICIIGHPDTQPKRIEAGSISEYSGDEIRYNDIDTLPGNSGSPIWHARTGNLIGVHVKGGCTGDDPEVGFNFGMRISSILKWSPTVQSLTLHAPPILAEHSLKAIDVSGISRDNGANIHQWEYVGGPNQRFWPAPRGGGPENYSFAADHSGKVLDVAEFSQQDGAPLHQWTWNDTPNQRFRVEPAGRGHRRLVAQHSGKVVDVGEFSLGSGAQIHQWTWVNHENQRFRFLAGPIFVQLSGKALDIAGFSRERGAPLHQWTYHGDVNQIFRFEPLGDGTYRIVADHSRKVLDVEGGDMANGARVLQWEWHGGPNQRFRLEPNVTAGEYRIVAVHSGKVLDVEGITNANGALIHQWDWVGGFNQLWRFG